MTAGRSPESCTSRTPARRGSPIAVRALGSTPAVESGRCARTRDGYERLAARCRLQRFGGDCYGFVLVASGCIDLMVDGSLMPYDIVPLIPIVEEAGGVITDLAGRTPMDGGTVIAAANASLHAAALELLNTRPR